MIPHCQKGVTLELVHILGRLNVAMLAIVRWGHVVALVRSHMNGLISFQGTIQQTTETMPYPYPCAEYSFRIHRHICRT